MINEGKRVAPVRVEYLRVKAEYERLVSEAAKSKENALNGLKNQSAEKERKVVELVGKFQTTVLLKVMEDCPGYDKLDAEFPYEELIPRIPAMERYEFGWKEKDLFESAEGAWAEARPCEAERVRKITEQFKDNVNRKAGTREVLTLDGIEYAFRWCPPGEFTMGAPRSEWPGHPWYLFYDETPHKVKLTKGFWLLETEVTQAMWESVMGESIETMAKQSNGNLDLRGTGSNFPMYYVSWNDCMEFCRGLRGKLGQSVWLPTEAQWEYACRAGTTGAYAGTLSEMAWYGEDWQTGSTHPVAQKKPNAWGLYDMHGNVDEWCSDWYLSDYYSKSPTSDPENNTESPYHYYCGGHRVYRGGHSRSVAEWCRSAFRLTERPKERENYLGFRVRLIPRQD